MRYKYYATNDNGNFMVATQEDISAEGLNADDELMYGTVDYEIDATGYEREKLADPNPASIGLQGLWHGYEDYDNDFPTEGITAFTIQEVSSDGLLKGSGLDALGFFNFEGSHRDKDGGTIFDFLRKYEDADDDNQYYSCGALISNEIEGDSLEGLWSMEKPECDKEITWLLQNPGWSAGVFKLQRKPLEFFTIRPDSIALAPNRIKALWLYAIEAARLHARSRLIRWELMHERRTRRKKYIDLYIKRDKDADMSSNESAQLVHLEKTLAPQDSLLYQSIARRSARRLMFL